MAGAESADSHKQKDESGRGADAHDKGQTDHSPVKQDGVYASHRVGGDRRANSEVEDVAHPYGGAQKVVAGIILRGPRSHAPRDVERQGVGHRAGNVDGEKYVVQPEKKLASFQSEIAACVFIHLMKKRG
jgi:hypothetical protein